MEENKSGGLWVAGGRGEREASFGYSHVVTGSILSSGSGI